jgi:hypothetical protein
MANYNGHKCFTCGQIFDYCRRCAITPVVYKAEGFCSEKCSHIFNTLSKHGCNLITADEALAELKAYNIDDIKLTEDVAAHIARIKSDVSVEEIPVEEVRTEKTVYQSNKNKKKKW